jgi:cellulose synthase/poly-beta-1,6-N-acetylglucosamine synthase-like glycosyltransferase
MKEGSKMKFNSLIIWLIVILILALILKFASFVFVAALRYWFITLPVILYFVIKNNGKKVKKDKKDNVEEADFEVIEEDEEK